MPRRYLSLSEAESALNRGKSLECFLGACTRNAKTGVRWLSVVRQGEEMRLSVFESADLGHAEFLDLYEFGPLDPEREQDEPDQVLVCKNFEALVAQVEALFPGSSAGFVHEGIVQDEYADFLARGRK